MTAPRRTVFRDSRTVSVLLWMVFTFVTLGGVFSDQTEVPHWVLYSLIGFYTLLWWWRQPRTGVYVEGTELLMVGVLRTTRVRVDQIAFVRKPGFGKPILTLDTGEELVIRTAPVNGRWRDHVVEEVERLITGSMGDRPRD